MKKAAAWRWLSGCLAISAAALVAPACGQVTAAGDDQRNLCPGSECEGGVGGGGNGGAGVRRGAGGTAGVGGGTAGVGGGIPSEVEVMMPPCTVCRRAENCCKAEGLADCNYTAACTSASTAEQMQFYLVLCRAVLDASAPGPRKRPAVCGSR